MADGKQETKDDIADTEFAPVTPTEQSEAEIDENTKRNLEMIYEIPISVSVELGFTAISIKELLTLGPGSVVELDRMAGEPVDLMVNGVLIGKGDVVVVNENFGLRVTEIVCLEERLKKISG